VEFQDAYLSVREALRHAAAHNDRDLELVWVHSEDLERNGCESALRQVNGIIVPGGFGVRGIEGMVKAARYARENNVPYFGLCLGMQVMVVEFARRVLHSDLPNSTEFNPGTPYPVIDMMAGQRQLENMGGTMRLGLYPCQLMEGTQAATAYGQPLVMERHRHRFEFNNRFRDLLTNGGLVASGISPDGTLVEISELREHPWMVGTQFHPEFRSRPNRPHPLFSDFIRAAKATPREGEQQPLPLA